MYSLKYFKICLNDVQEIKFEPNVMCERIDKRLPFRSSQVCLVHGYRDCKVPVSCTGIFELGFFIACSWRMVTLYAIRNPLHLAIMSQSVILMFHLFWNMFVIGRYMLIILWYLVNNQTCIPFVFFRVYI